jgi:hypothetical protein
MSLWPSIKRWFFLQHQSSHTAVRKIADLAPNYSTHLFASARPICRQVDKYNLLGWLIMLSCRCYKWFINLLFSNLIGQNVTTMIKNVIPPQSSGSTTACTVVLRCVCRRCICRRAPTLPTNHSSFSIVHTAITDRVPPFSINKSVGVDLQSSRALSG